MISDPRIERLTTLIGAAMRPPLGAGRIALALVLGFLCHSQFEAAVLAMIVATLFGLSESFNIVPWSWAAVTNVVLVTQFPSAHSLLLTKRGGLIDPLGIGHIQRKGMDVGMKPRKAGRAARGGGNLHA